MIDVYTLYSVKLISSKMRSFLVNALKFIYCRPILVVFALCKEVQYTSPTSNLWRKSREVRNWI